MRKHVIAIVLVILSILFTMMYAQTHNIWFLVVAICTACITVLVELVYKK